MMYLISTFFFWLLLAGALGVLVSWITCGRGEGSFFGGIIPWVLLLGLGGLMALAQWLPQRPGFWLDLAVLMLAAYFAGCCVGCILGQMFGKSLGEPIKSGALVKATSRPVTRVMIREKERAVEPQLKPLAAAAAAPEEAVVGLSGPRGGAADDLTKIYGIDAETQGKLNGLGIYHYDQLANLTPGNRRWVFRNLGHEGRFPSWWWRWRYDAEKLMGGGDGAVAAGVSGTDEGDSSTTGGSAAVETSGSVEGSVANADAATDGDKKASGKKAGGKKASAKTSDMAGSEAAAAAGTGDTGPSDTAEGVASGSAATDSAAAISGAATADATASNGNDAPSGGAVGLTSATAGSAEDRAAAAAATATADASGGERPPTLDAPRDGKADDLKRIRGIGKQNEGRLHGLGIWHFDQIAGWSVEQVHWVGAYLAFPGRIEREDWVAQAKVLATGGETDFSKRADAGKVKTSRSDVDHGETNVAVPGKDFVPKKPGGKK